MATVEWEHVAHFGADEFTAPDLVERVLVMRLDRARERAGVPIYITSDFREGDDGAHGKGLAVDVSDNLSGEDCGSRWRYHVVKAFLRTGFNRIGVYDRHIHVDIDEDRDADVMWWGESD